MKTFLTGAILLVAFTLTMIAIATDSDASMIKVFPEFHVDQDYDTRAVDAVRKVSKEEIDFMVCNLLVGNLPICSTQDSEYIYTVIFNYRFDAIVISTRKD